MSLKAFVVLSHRLMAEQEKELRETWGVGELVKLPGDLEALWGSVPPGEDSVGGFLEPVTRWLEERSSPGDVAFIQGEFGSVYWMVGEALRMGLVPVHSTTRRVLEEEAREDGVYQRRVFSHVRFRVYGR